MPIQPHPVRLAIFSVGLALTGAISVVPASLLAQAPAGAARTAPQRGTVKAIEGSKLTITTDAGQEVAVDVPAAARIQKLAPGSTDLKTAETATLPDIAVGDRVLVAATPGDSASALTATRVILMKSGDIAQKHEAEQQDWQRRGAGGIVTAIDPSGGISVSSGARKLDVTTSATTTYRRYADGSVKFEDAKPGTLSQIHTGDQLLARGAKSSDGASMAAEEVVSGSFKNLSGTITTIDAARNTVSLKDLVSKRNVTVQLTPNSALHRLPPEAAARFAARAKGGADGAQGARPAGDAAAAGGRPHGDAAGAGGRPAGDAAAGGRPVGDASAAGGRSHEGMGRTSGGDLSQTVARLPSVPVTDLHNGDAVMIVAEQSSTDASTLTAITLLAGVEPILAAAPSGSASMTLSPWSVGNGAPEAGGTQ